MATTIWTAALRVLLIIDGVFLAVLAALSFVAACVAPDDHPTRLLGQVVGMWEVVYIVAALPLTIAMCSVAALVRSTSTWTLAVLSSAALLVACAVGLLRQTGSIEIAFPVVTWVPASVLISLWAWAAAQAHVHRELWPRRLRTFAAVIAALQVLIVGFIVAVFGVNAGNQLALNLVAGILVPTISAGGAVWWISSGLLLSVRT